MQCLLFWGRISILAIIAGMQLYTFEEGVILAAAGCSCLPGSAMSGVVLDRSSLRAPPNCICSSPPCPGPQAQRLKTQFGQIFWKSCQICLQQLLHAWSVWCMQLNGRIAGFSWKLKKLNRLLWSEQNLPSMWNLSLWHIFSEQELELKVKSRLWLFWGNWPNIAGG